MWNYKPKSDFQLRLWYAGKESKKLMAFDSFDHFLNWYSASKKICHYCGVSELEVQEAVHKGLLTSSRFPVDGKLTRGRSRGYWLEIDRKSPKCMYNPLNCVLACYFCNNDKSDVFSRDQYIEFQSNRAGFIRDLLN